MSEQNNCGTKLPCIIYTEADISLIRRKHLREFASVKIPYDANEADTFSKKKGAIRCNSQRVSQNFNQPAFRLNTKEGSAQFQNVELYILEPADEIVFGFTLKKATGFDISAFVVIIAMNLDGFNLKIQADSQEAEVRRLFNKSAGDYVPIQLEPRTSLDDSDPLKQDAPCLTMGEVDPKEERELKLAVRDKAYYLIHGYWADPHYERQIPSKAEADPDKLLKTF